MSFAKLDSVEIVVLKLTIEVIHLAMYDIKRIFKYLE